MFMDMTEMFNKFKEVQTKLKQIQENREYITAIGESGAGMIKATVNGNKEIINIEISDELFKLENKDMLKDLIIAAVNKAVKQIAEKTKEAFQKSTGGILPNIPGIDFSSIE